MITEMCDINKMMTWPEKCSAFLDPLCGESTSDPRIFFTIDHLSCARCSWEIGRMNSWTTSRIVGDLRHILDASKQAHVTLSQRKLKWSIGYVWKQCSENVQVLIPNIYIASICHHRRSFVWFAMLNIDAINDILLLCMYSKYVWNVMNLNKIN